MKLFELYNKRPARDNTALNAAVKLCEGIIKVLEAPQYDHGIDFEPQADFRNVKGVNIDDKDQRIAGQQDNSAQEAQKLNKAWVMLISKMKGLGPDQRKVLRPKLQQFAKIAKQRRIKLVPSAEQVFNL